MFEDLKGNMNDVCEEYTTGQQGADVLWKRVQSQLKDNSSIVSLFHHKALMTEHLQEETKDIINHGFTSKPGRRKVMGIKKLWKSRSLEEMVDLLMEPPISEGQKRMCKLVGDLSDQGSEYQDSDYMLEEDEMKELKVIRVFRERLKTAKDKMKKKYEEMFDQDVQELQRRSKEFVEGLILKATQGLQADHSKEERAIRSLFSEKNYMNRKFRRDMQREVKEHYDKSSRKAMNVYLPYYQDQIEKRCAAYRELLQAQYSYQLTTARQQVYNDYRNKLRLKITDWERMVGIGARKAEEATSRETERMRSDLAEELWELEREEEERTGARLREAAGRVGGGASPSWEAALSSETCGASPVAPGPETWRDSLAAPGPETWQASPAAPVPETWRPSSVAPGQETWRASLAAPGPETWRASPATPGPETWRASPAAPGPETWQASLAALLGLYENLVAYALGQPADYLVGKDRLQEAWHRILQCQREMEELAQREEPSCSLDDLEVKEETTGKSIQEEEGALGAVASVIEAAIRKALPSESELQVGQEEGGSGTQVDESSEIKKPKVKYWNEEGSKRSGKSEKTSEGRQTVEEIVESLLGTVVTEGEARRQDSFRRGTGTGLAFWLPGRSVKQEVDERIERFRAGLGVARLAELVDIVTRNPHLMRHCTV